ncbi:MAG: hypothetical protein WBL45_12725 [Solirubrobacterales bacterium]
MAIFAIARRNRCRTVVVEDRYIDADYRSDFSAFWSKRFEVPSPYTRRLHFFRAGIAQGDLALMPKRIRESYLGYSVLRPGPHPDGRVGRTVMTPPSALAGATLVTIDDEVSLYGNDLSVTGVPFLEQDGEFLRCAHAAIWGCHYVAFRRGLVGRRLTAELAEMTPRLLSADRSLPSRGMVLQQIQAVFDATGQPALRYIIDQLPTVPGVEVPSEQMKEEHAGQPAGYWDPRLFSVICRYLNSGFPVMVTNATHGWNLVGWFWQKNQIRFVACDDQVGPYEVIDSPFTDGRRPWLSIMVPLPPKVYMSAEAAEIWGRQRLLEFGRRTNALPSWRELTKDLAQVPKKAVSLRTFLRDSRRYKAKLPTQGRPSEAVDALRLAGLPNFIWVVEAHDRRLRAMGKPSVLAEVLFDPHSSDHHDREPRSDAISMPGLTVITPPEGGPLVAINTPDRPWRSQLAR